MTPVSRARFAPLGAGLTLVLICLALGLVSALEMRHMSVTHGTPIGWRAVLTSTMPRWILLAATLPFALRLALLPSARPVRMRHVLVHATLFLVISVAHALVVTQGMSLTTPVALFFPWHARVLRSWYNAMPILVSLYGAVLAAAWALHEARESARRAVRAAEAETQLQKARLAAVHARLQPHFLYNALHGIAALAADDGATRAVTAIDQLSELLHASLRVDDRQEIALGEELQLTERYLWLQEMRFGERLSWSIDVAPDLRDCLVPVLLLQPLAENAVVHGLEAGRPRVRVEITARRRGDSIELRIANDGPAPGSSTAPRNGVGLTATQERLRTAYGDRAALRLRARDGGGASVDIVLPFVRPGGPSAGTPALAGVG